MTNRYSITYRWASDPSSSVVDPDDDINHPSGEGGAGKYNMGWEVETEPHEWENYVIKRYEDLNVEKMEDGWSIYRTGVAFRTNCLALYNGVPSVYIGTIPADALMHENGVDNLYTEYMEYILEENAVDVFAEEDNWTPILNYKLSEYNTTINGIKTSLTTHINTKLQHQETISQIGGYTQDEIEAILEVSNQSYLSHAGNYYNPHQDTCANIGTIHHSGGDFNGKVYYREGIRFGYYIPPVDSETLILDFINNTYSVYEPPEGLPDGELIFDGDKFIMSKDWHGAIGLGTSDYYKGGRWERILCENTHLNFEADYNSDFIFAIPDVFVPLKFDLKSEYTNVTFTRNSTLDYIDRTGVSKTAAVNEPAFELTGLKLTADTSIKISYPSLLGCKEGTVAYVLNDVLVIKDVHFLSEELTYYFGTTGNIRNFFYWSKRLTPYQRLRIPT